MKLILHIELHGNETAQHDDFRNLADSVVRRGKRPIYLDLPNGAMVQANLTQVEVPNDG